MLKKILILALILNTPYARPSNSAASPQYDMAAICAAAGSICGWIAYKDFIKGWPAQKEVFCQIDILHGMGCKVLRVSKVDVRWDGSLVVKEHYKLEIPSSFSPEERAKANAHWEILLINDIYDKNMLGWPSIAAMFLLFGSYQAFNGL